MLDLLKFIVLLFYFSLKQAQAGRNSSVASIDLLSINLCTGLAIGFTEAIFQANEGHPCLNVVINREGRLDEDIVVEIQPLTYQEFLENGFILLPDTLTFRELPDPAESKCIAVVKIRYSPMHPLKDKTLVVM